MDTQKMKNVIILKNLPSNLIDEAIMVVKDKNKVKDINYSDFIKYKEENGIIQGSMKPEELKKIESIKKESRKYVIKEAELDVNLPEARLIFVKPNGQFRGTETPRHAYKVINYELKIPSRFHDFRDTHATRLIEQGADIKAVSKRLGHSTIMTTYNIYVRVTEKMETDTVDRFESYTNSLDIPDNEEILYKD